MHLVASKAGLWRWVRWIIVLAVTQAFLLLLLGWIVPGFEVHSLRAALFAGLVITGVTAVCWPFIYRIAAWSHPLLFPLISFVLTAWLVSLCGELVDVVDEGGVEIASYWTALFVAMGLTIGNTLLSAIFSINDEDA